MSVTDRTTRGPARWHNSTKKKEQQQQEEHGRKEVGKAKKKLRVDQVRRPLLCYGRQSRSPFVFFCFFFSFFRSRWQLDPTAGVPDLSGRVGCSFFFSFSYFFLPLILSSLLPPFGGSSCATRDVAHSAQSVEEETTKGNRIRWKRKRHAIGGSPDRSSSPLCSSS